VDLRDYSPTTRSLYWYLRWKNGPVTIHDVTLESGIPESSVYQAIKKAPHLFRHDPRDPRILQLDSRSNHDHNPH
jgi:hypothetical protein